jgi:hypothetical protein
MIITDLAPGEYDAVLRQDLASFAARCFSDLNPQVDLMMSIGVQKAPRIGVQKGPLFGVGSGLSR